MSLSSPFRDWNEADVAKYNAERRRGKPQERRNSADSPCVAREEAAKGIPVYPESSQGSYSPSLRIVLPLAPSTNSAYFTDKDGRRRISWAAKKFKLHAQKEAQACALVSKWKYTPGYSLKVSIYLAIKNRNRDAGNCEKLAIDAIAYELGFNDKCVSQIHIYRTHSDSPGMVVELEVLP